MQLAACGRRLTPLLAEARLTYHELVPVAPLIFAIHNAEEAPQMAAWSETMPGRFHPRVTTRQFTIAVSTLTLLVGGVATWAYVAPDEVVAQITFLALQAAIFFNVFVPHVLLFVRWRRYNPGLLSAAFFTLPFSLYFFHQALAAGRVSSTTLALLLVLAPGIMVGSAAAALRFGAAVAGASQRTQPKS